MKFRHAYTGTPKQSLVRSQEINLPYLVADYPQTSLGRQKIFICFTFLIIFYIHACVYTHTRFYICNCLMQPVLSISTYLYPIFSKKPELCHSILMEQRNCTVSSSELPPPITHPGQCNTFNSLIFRRFSCFSHFE